MGITKCLRGKDQTMAKQYNHRELAHLAGVSTPDSATSPGAEFLASILEDVNARNRDLDPEDVAENIAAGHRGDAGGFTSDYEMWQTFLDLEAYREEVEDLNLTSPHDLAYHALGQIAYRLTIRRERGCTLTTAQ